MTRIGQGVGLSDIDTMIQRTMRLSPGRLETIPRGWATGTLAVPSGTLVISLVDAPFAATAPVSNLEVVTGNTAPSGITLSRLAFFNRDASDNLSLVAFTADFHTSVAIATDFTVPLAAGVTLAGVTCPSTITWARGGRYAIGYLWTGTAHPTLRAANSNAGPWSRTPRMAAYLPAQTDIPATVSAASFTDAVGAVYFSACSSATG